MRQQDSQSVDLRPYDFFSARIVIVAAHECDGCDGSQSIDDGAAADIAGVEDVIHAGEKLEHAFVQTSMCVSD